MATFPEREIMFDDNWQFAVNKEAAATTPTTVFFNAHAPDYDDSEWRTVTVPHDWSIEDIEPENNAFDGPFDPKSVGKKCQGFTVGGVGWYRKRFSLDESLKDKRVIICFDGVYRNADIWINSHRLGNHPYGYTSFHYDLTDHVKWDEENVMAVEVKNTGRNSRWYSGSGIYRHVRLMHVDQVHIAVNGTFVTTPEVLDTEATVIVSNELVNHTDEEQDREVTVVLKDAAGDVVAEQRITTQCLPNQTYELKHRLTVPTPQLWSVDTPVLYTAETTITLDGETVDQVQTTFGVREIAIDPVKGFRLNDKSMLLKGGCVHHDNGPLGSAAFDDAEERRVQLLKDAGFNAIRCAHNPPSSAFLDACDRIGVLVIDEAFDHWNKAKNSDDYHLYFAEHGEADIASMVKRDRNHPSVIMWSIGNEIPEQGAVLGSQAAQKLVEAIRLHDRSRPTTIALHPQDPWEKHDGINNVVDVCGYNYRPDRYETDHERNPSRIIYGSETFAFDFHKYWSLVEKCPYVIGDFVWTSFDYLGEGGIGWRGWNSVPYPWTVAYCGDVDICGHRRPQSHYREMFWNDEPTLDLYVRSPESTFGDERESPWSFDDIHPIWNWPGNESNELDVVIHSTCEAVELKLNGESLGTKEFPAECKHQQEWKVPYAAGTLEAIGLVKGEVVERKILETTGTPATTKLTAQSDVISAGEQGLAFIDIELVDIEGRLVYGDLQLDLKIDGPAQLAAFASARPNSTESFQRQQRTTFQGRALLILRSTQDAGEVTVTIEGPGLEPSTISLTAE